METTSMMKLLKSFCNYSHWNYAVFWKLNHHFPMALTWEDGCYGDFRINEGVETMWTEVASSSYGSSEGNSVRLLMTEMSHLKYILGEGVVGKTALTGDHCWILFEDILTGKFQTKLIECPYEWLLQFESAIKTIVLVPVLPQGVLQFGSFKAVAEDLAFVANVKEKFNFFRCIMANTPTLSSDEDIQDWSFSALTDCPLDYSVVSSVTNGALTHELFGGDSPNINELRLNNSTAPLLVPVEGSVSRKNETSPSSTGVSNDNGQVEFKPNQMEEVIETCSPCLNNVGVSGETPEGLFSYSRMDMAEQFGGSGTDFEDCNMVNSFCSFPLDYELHKALGPTANRQTFEPEAENFSSEDTYITSSSLISGEKEHGHIMGLQSSNRVRSEYLLDAVVGSIRSASDDSLSMLPTMLTASIHPQSHHEGSTSVAYNADSSSHLTSAFGANIVDCTDLLTLASLDDNSSILLDGTQQESVHVQKKSKSGPKLSSIGKKRARAGNTPRPRPRDRQLIMDRMKELRELVPDGAKCSIDNLLDRTIKHMVYLREITNQAEKMKQFENKEVPEFKKQKINGNHTGRSCAIDFGSELQVCPIAIEDLEWPGHMLIEVLCSEHGLFLEIAQVIRRLELTILKGVLESSSSTVWARFIVEAPRGFHRMDVLRPLLHLLQTGTSPVSNRI